MPHKRVLIIKRRFILVWVKKSKVFVFGDRFTAFCQTFRQVFSGLNVNSDSKQTFKRSMDNGRREKKV